jgi:hypothetical protein
MAYIQRITASWPWPAGEASPLAPNRTKNKNKNKNKRENCSPGLDSAPSPWDRRLSTPVPALPALSKPPSPTLHPSHHSFHGSSPRVKHRFDILRLSIILRSRYWPSHLPTHTNFRRRQKLQNSGCTSLIPEQLRHGSVPRRPLPFRCLANCAPHGDPLILPLAAVFEEVFARLRGTAAAPPALVIRRFFPTVGGGDSTTCSVSDAR